MAGSNSTSTREKLLGLVDDIELITKEIFENAIAPKVIKVKSIIEDSLDSIPSPSPSVKIQIMSGEFGLRCKGKILRGFVNKLFVQ